MGYADYFSNVLNQALGKPLGHQYQSPKQVRVAPRDFIPDRRDVAEGIRQGIIDVDSDVENRIEESQEALRKSQNELARGTFQIDDVTRERMRGLRDKILEESRIDYAAKTAMKNLEEGSNPVSRTMGGAFDWTMRMLDKPINAVEGFMEEGPRNDEGTGDEYFNWSQMWKGISQGFNQKKDYDFGRVAEQYIPDAPHPVKVAAAVSGNLFLDPTNLVGLGGVKYAAKGKKVLDATRLADTTADALIDAFRKSGVSAGTKARKIPGSANLYGTAEQAAEETIRQRARALIQNQVLNIKGGGVRNRLNVGSRLQHAETQSTNAGAAFRKFRQEKFDDLVEQYKAHIDDQFGPGGSGKGTLTPTQIKQMRKSDDMFDEFIRNLHPNGNTHAAWYQAMDNVEDIIRRTIDKDIETFQDAAFKSVAGSYHHAPAIRVGPATIPLRSVGKALEWTTGKAFPNAASMARMKALSHSGMFPGKLALLIQRGRSVGVKKMDEFEKLVSRFARDYDRNERKLIAETLENGGSFAGNQHMQDGLDFVKRELDRMWDEEVAHGARNPKKTRKLSNYSFVWNRKGGRHALEDFKLGRKNQINSTKASASNFNIAGAKAKGLKPVEDAFDMLLMRQLKSNRDITRALFANDLLDNYGHAARGLSKDAADRRGLVGISDDKINDYLKQKYNPNMGDKYYLPKEMHEALRNFEDLSRFTTDPGWLRVIRKITNFFKSGATVYNPGYHVRNMISDFAMGMLDGVRGRTYLEMMRKGTFRRVVVDPATGLKTKVPRLQFRSNAKFNIGKGKTISGYELQDLFKRNASGGGFYGEEFGRNPVSTFLGKINKGVRSVSESREDFGRIGHFLSALRDEFQGLRKTGMSIDDAFAKATEQATYRVNHYKFDYGAMTRGEQKYLKAAFPFYTFTRKAVPTLMESFAMNPKWLRRYGALKESFDGDESKNFNSYFIPQYIKDMGYATLRDEAEPTIATLETLPTGSISNVIPKDPTAGGLMDMILQQLNPVAQAPFEIRTGKEFYADRDVGGLLPSWGEPGGGIMPDDLGYFGRKFVPPASNLQKGYGDITGGESLWKTALTNRLAGGLPIRKVTKDQMDFARKQWEDKYIEKPFDDFNEGEGSEKGIRIYLSKPSSGYSSYKVKDNNTGRVLYEGANPWDALEFAKSGQSELPSSMNDFNDTIGSQTNTRVYFSDRKDGKSYRVKDTRSGRILLNTKDPVEAMEYANSRAGSY